jgi:hypothetical protein
LFIKSLNSIKNVRDPNENHNMDSIEDGSEEGKDVNLLLSGVGSLREGINKFRIAQPATSVEEYGEEYEEEKDEPEQMILFTKATNPEMFDIPEFKEHLDFEKVSY